jgi:hypothetical protein
LCESLHIRPVTARVVKGNGPGIVESCTLLIEYMKRIFDSFKVRPHLTTPAAAGTLGHERAGGRLRQPGRGDRRAPGRPEGPAPGGAQPQPPDRRSGLRAGPAPAGRRPLAYGASPAGRSAASPALRRGHPGPEGQRLGADLPGAPAGARSPGLLPHHPERPGRAGAGPQPGRGAGRARLRALGSFHDRPRGLPAHRSGPFLLPAGRPRPAAARALLSGSSPSSPVPISPRRCGPSWPSRPPSPPWGPSAACASAGWPPRRKAAG